MSMRKLSLSGNTDFCIHLGRVQTNDDGIIKRDVLFRLNDVYIASDKGYIDEHLNNPGLSVGVSREPEKAKTEERSTKGKMRRALSWNLNATNRSPRKRCKLGMKPD